MIKERYVNLEVAKLLRDKGFDEKCVKIYNINNGLIFENYNICNSDLTENSELVTVPTQAMACDWVEETFNISIEVYANIIEDDMTSGDNIDGSWSSKELVYNEALKYVLTNLV